MIIAECFRKKIFPERNPAFLAAFVAVFVNEREFFDKAFMSAAPENLKKIFGDMTKRLKPFHNLLLKNHFSARPLFFAPAVIIYSWASGAAWEETLDISGLAEGDLAMLILRTADNLRHIRALKDIFPKISGTAALAIDLLMKEPVLM